MSIYRECDRCGARTIIHRPDGFMNLAEGANEWDMVRDTDLCPKCCRDIDAFLMKSIVPMKLFKCSKYPSHATWSSSKENPWCPDCYPAEQNVGVKL